MGPELEASQANISQHLAALRDASLVIDQRDGVRIQYRATDKRVFQVLDLLAAIRHDQFNQARQALASLELARA